MSDINLIYPGRDTATLVKTMDPQWLVVGPIRACIHLSNVWHLLDPAALAKTKDTVGGKGAIHYSLNGANVFGPNVLDHSWTKWAATCVENYSWLLFFAQDMCAEYIIRFPHVSKHGVSRMLEALENMPESLPEGEWTEPWFAKDVEVQ
jgi:hypothetical protein